MKLDRLIAACKETFWSQEIWKQNVYPMTVELACHQVVERQVTTIAKALQLVTELWRQQQPIPPQVENAQGDGWLEFFQQIISLSITQQLLRSDASVRAEEQRRLRKYT